MTTLTFQRRHLSGFGATMASIAALVQPFATTMTVGTVLVLFGAEAWPLTLVVIMAITFVAACVTSLLFLRWVAATTDFDSGSLFVVTGICWLVGAGLALLICGSLFGEPGAAILLPWFGMGGIIIPALGME